MLRLLPLAVSVVLASSALAAEPKPIGLEMSEEAFRAPLLVCLFSPDHAKLVCGSVREYVAAETKKRAAEKARQRAKEFEL